MESLYKNRLLFWVLLFLVIANLSALASYFFFPVKQTEVSCLNDPNAPGCVLHSTLDLTEEQVQLVDGINASYQEVSRPISEEIKKLRADIVDELASDEPDTVHINQLSQEISIQQNQLHRANIRHYLELKKVCNTDQAMRLSNLYREIYGCPMQEEGKGMKHRRHM